MSASLTDVHGAALDAREVVSGARLTVLVFFSATCHCLRQHDARLRELYEGYRSRGVEVLMIDSEKRASPEEDAAEAARRGYRFPILLDPGGRLADAVGAEYSTYTVIVDPDGRILYRGGIDSDAMHLRPDTQPYLRDALDDLLAGRAPRTAATKSLGCSLQKW